MITPCVWADGISEHLLITGQTDQQVCGFFGWGTCQKFSFDLLATVKPYHGYLEVTRLTGELNGERITAPQPDGLLAGGFLGDFNDLRGPIPFAPGVPPEFQLPNDDQVSFLLDHRKYYFSYDDMITGSLFLEGADITGVPVSWNAVATPEPAAWLLLCVGIIALGALGAARRFL
jgi:hypothetical protein